MAMAMSMYFVSLLSEKVHSTGKIPSAPFYYKVLGKSLHFSVSQILHTASLFVHKSE
jgi:hypothetical protein